MSTNNRLDLNRRAFLAAVPAVCAAPLLAGGEEKLAVDGNPCVRQSCTPNVRGLSSMTTGSAQN